MKIGVITDEKNKAELLEPGLPEGVEFVWLTRPENVAGAEAYLDLLFSPDSERAEVLKSLPAVPILLNSVTGTREAYPGHFFRFNGWNSFLRRTLWELSGPVGTLHTQAESVCKALGRTVEWVPDVPGFVSARVVSMIINEAYFALEESVSSREDIDTAMKLGTNYPYGPFAWAKVIGTDRVYDLLEVLARTQSRYQPSALLKKEAFGS